MADVKIRVIGEDKASAELKKIDASLEEIGKTAGATRGGLSNLEKATMGMRSQFNLLNDDMVIGGMNLGNLQGAFQALGVSLPTSPAQAFTMVLGEVNKFIRSSIDETVRYAQTVREMGDAMGWSYEETSRAIQVADDYQISMESVRTALEMATKNGMEPGIEGLARLADQFVATQDPNRRAAEMAKVFGRNWAELVPLLKLGGDELRKQAAEIDKSLVLTAEAIKATQDYQKALDNLNDTVNALKTSLGLGLIPVLNVNLGLLNSIIQATLNTGNATQGVIEGLREFGNLRIEEKAKEAEDLARVTAEQADAASHAAYANQDWIAILGYASASELFLSTTVTDTSDSLAAQEVQYARLVATQNEYKQVTDEIAAAQKDLIAANQEWQNAAKQWSDTVGNEVVKALKDAKLDSDKYREALSMVDSVLGTTYGRQEDFSTSVGNLVTQWAQGKITSDEFKTGLQGIRTEFTDLAPALQDAIDKLATIDAKLSALENRRVTIWIDYKESGSTSARGQVTRGRAAGGDIDPFLPYLVGEQGPELIMPRSPGTVIPAPETRALLSAPYSPLYTQNNQTIIINQHFYDEGAAALGLAQVSVLRRQRLDASMGG